MSIIYSDKMIVFKASAINAVKAKEECDSLMGTGVDVHDEFIVVKFWPCWQSRANVRGIDEAFKKAREILDKYDISYKIKKFTF